LHKKAKKSVVIRNVRKRIQRYRFGVEFNAFLYVT